LMKQACGANIIKTENRITPVVALGKVQ
jgi:hypothetical protein